MSADTESEETKRYFDELLQSVKSEIDTEKDQRRRARNKRKAAKRKLKAKR